MTIDNNTGKNKEFYDLGKKMFDRIKPLNERSQTKPSIKRPIESDYASQVAYTRALEMYCDSLAQPDYRAVKTYHEGKPVYVSLPEQEPVATVTSESGNAEVKMSWWHEPALPIGTKLYTTPPKRQPLTNDQIYEMYNEPRSNAEILEFARAIEAAHNIKEQP